MARHSLELDDKSRQQIAAFAGVLGALVAAMLAASTGDHTPRIDPFATGALGFVLSFVAGLLSRRLGAGIIVVASLILFATCSFSGG